MAGHIHGKRFLEDAHPSPEYILGEIKLKNGVRANIQCGYFSQPHSLHQADYETMNFDFDFWTDCRLTVYSNTGYAWAECNGKWGAFTSQTNSKAESGKCGGFLDEGSSSQILYATEFTDWMDDDKKIHSCTINQAYEGYQILEAIYMSALDKQRVDLPLVLPLNKDLLVRMKTEL